ncbi:hypothetical protein ACRAWF_33000 [Streptomyces sp. L7]
MAGLTRQGVLKDVSLQVRAGEIVGLAGLVGERSQRDRPRGLRRGPARRRRDPPGRRAPHDPAPSRRHRPWHRDDPGVPADVGGASRSARPVGDNITLAHLDEISTGPFVNRLRERRSVASLMSRFDVRAGSPRAPVGALSGGNQQKSSVRQVVHAPAARADRGRAYAGRRHRREARDLRDPQHARRRRCRHSACLLRARRAPQPRAPCPRRSRRCRHLTVRGGHVASPGRAPGAQFGDRGQRPSPTASTTPSGDVTTAIATAEEST